MSRDLDTDLATEVQAAALMPIFLVEALFDSGAVRLWNGYGDIVWGADTYTGGGDLLKVTDISETQDIQAQGCKFILSGISSEIISLALTENFTGRTVNMYFGCLDSTGAFVGDPYQIFSGIMDTLEIKETGETCDVTLSAENKMIDLKKSKVSRYTSEDQKRTYSSDKGFDYVPAIQEKEIIWGRKTPV